LLSLILLTSCARTVHKKVIVVGVDGMDPVFVEQHWGDLPNLARLRGKGSYSHLETTDPPQSQASMASSISYIVIP